MNLTLTSNLTSYTMGRKNKSSKAAEKKRERLALAKINDERVKIVNEANKQEDPLQALPSFKVKKGFFFSTRALRHS